MRARLAARMHHHPANRLFVVGVTGTDGKTTVCTLLYHFLQSSGYKTVFIGTTGAKINGHDVPWIEKMTSYDPMDLQSILELAVTSWCTHAVLETSSHGLQQYRFTGVHFDVWVLTNITAEHLDYHGNIDQYALTKQKLFRFVQDQGKKGTAILPLDDLYGRRWSQRMHFGNLTTYGLTPTANLQGTMIREQIDHTTFSINYGGRSYTISSPLLGRFNVQNMLAAIGAWLACNLPIEGMIGSLSTYQHAPGRQTHLSFGWIDRYIDFAHTPNGLEMMLSYLQTVNDWWRIICLFGAPGMRDRQKRPDMGKVVDTLADIVILTDDDAAEENRRQILADVKQWIKRAEGETFAIIPERRQAIAYLCLIAKPGDKVLLAGKGHEQVLVTNTGKIKRDEATILQEERQKTKKQQ